MEKVVAPLCVMGLGLRFSLWGAIGVKLMPRLGIDKGQFGSLISLFMGSCLVLSLAMGVILDSVGYMPVAVFGFAVVSCCLFVLACAHVFPVVLGVCVLLGAGAMALNAAGDTLAYPRSRLERDWIYQDHGLKHAECFVAAEGGKFEHAMVRKVLAELQSRNVAVEALEESLALLVSGKRPGRDPMWKSLYLQACELRRRQRLKVFDRHPREFVYAKHFVFGDCQAMFAMTDHLTDAVFRECGPDYRMNSQLCKMTINADGTVATEVLLDCREGVVRDPCVSYDGRTLVFSMRRTSHDGDDDFHLYVMNLTDRSVRQITFGPARRTWSRNGCPTRVGLHVTRCVISAPCWCRVCATCSRAIGRRYIRRLACDHAIRCFAHDGGRPDHVYPLGVFRQDRRLSPQPVRHESRRHQSGGVLREQLAVSGRAAACSRYSQFDCSDCHFRRPSYRPARQVDHDRPGCGDPGGLWRQTPGAGTGLPVSRRVGTGGNVVHDTEGEQFQYPYPLVKTINAV